jgi:hypothetical protein
MEVKQALVVSCGYTDRPPRLHQVQRHIYDHVLLASNHAPASELD